MNKQTLTFNSYAPLGQLVITRNGEIEQSHTEALQADMRREALRYIGTKTIDLLYDATYATAAGIGKILLRVSHDLDSSYVAPIVKIEEVEVSQSRNEFGQFV